MLVIRRYYPGACERLDEARAQRSELAAVWRSILDEGVLITEIVVDDDRSGRFLMHADWPVGARERLTAVFRQCLTELWGCLDSLIVESVEQFAVLRRPRDPDRPRFFPIADSIEGLDALLAEGCLDGILRSQVEVVRACQPFLGPAGHPRLTGIRVALERLLSWEHHLEAGAALGAWVTPVSPELRVAEPARITELLVAEPGELVDERVIATFRLANRCVGEQVTGRAGTFADVCLAAGFSPVDQDDTLDSRLRDVVKALQFICAYFASLSHEVGGSRRVLVEPRPGRTWSDATRSPRRWSARELAMVKQSDFGVGRVVGGSDDLLLIVDTDHGPFERLVPRVSPVREQVEIGIAAEAAIRDAAATWGLPDFVMAPSVERKGTGVREISDGLLVVGHRGVIVQSKARETEPGPPEREKAWVEKQIRKAGKQVHGTARRLAREATTMRNGRGREIAIDGPSIEWAGVVIIEHPCPPAELPVPAFDGATPVIVLLRRDWEFLFDQLRSTYAVVGYLHRVGESAEVLGTEPERYYELARADREAEPAPLTEHLVGPATAHSVPLLPMAPAGSDDDRAHAMVRIMLEDIATSPYDHDRIAAMQDVLASIDSLPVAYRTELGRLLRTALTELRNSGGETIGWRSRIFMDADGELQLGFVVCSTLNEEIRAVFNAWLELRHHERCQRLGTCELSSVGVMLTPRSDGRREWDTTMSALRGDVGLTAEQIRLYAELLNSSWADHAPPPPS